jgi:two-component system CheB/CheR fusion protein
VDNDGVYQDVNESFCRMLKTTKKKLIGSHFSKHISKKILPLADKAFKELRETGTFEGEFPMLAEDGSTVELEWRSRADFVLGLHCCVARNITARDEFLSIASHELKTPITVIKGFMQILQKQLSGKADKLTMKSLDRAQVQVERLTNLVNDLLDVTKIHAGKLVFNREVCDINVLVKEVVSDFQLTRKSHDVTTKGNSKSKFWGDYERIRQVMNNLLSNAIKYSPNSDKVEVTIKDTVEKGKSVGITVAVKDFGVGIDKKSLPKIFDRFFRANSIEGAMSSLGLGLYISSEIIRRHKGKIWVNSQKGKGSTFTFQLPVFEEG